MEFKRGQFKINGRHSSEFNVYMSERPQRLSASRVVELRHRPGNHSLVVDYGYYQNVEWSIKCYAKVRTLDEVSNHEDLITEWLDSSKYSDFYYFFDKNYIYQAMVVSPPNFNGTRKHGNLIPFDFRISLQPMKQTVSGRNAIDLKNNDLLSNSRKYHSKPRIKILGRGDISFFINKDEFKIKNVPEEIIIDSEVEESFQYHNGEVLFLDDRTIFKDFPLLYPGNNQIKWNGQVDKFEIIPRWVTKV